MGQSDNFSVDSY